MVTQSWGRGAVPQLARLHHVGVDRDVHCAGGEIFVETQYVEPAGDEAVRLKQRFAVRSTVASECETYLVPLRLRIAKLLPAGS